jgi:hypothetical protein
MVRVHSNSARRNQWGLKILVQQYYLLYVTFIPEKAILYRKKKIVRSFVTYSINYLRITFNNSLI